MVRQPHYTYTLSIFILFLLDRSLFSQMIDEGKVNASDASDKGHCTLGE